MSVPPPPNDAPPPGYGGGFGPPQSPGQPLPPGGAGYGQQPPAPGGYGPQPPASGGYGQPVAGGPPGPGYGYGPQGPPGYGPDVYATYPPPPPRFSNGAKVAAFVAGAVVLMAIVGGAIVWLGSGYDDQGNDAGAGTSLPSRDPVVDPVGGGLPSFSASPPSVPTPTPSATHAYMPYVKLSPGSCFDSPSLDSGVNVITKVSCDSPHDGEVISNESLSGVIGSEEQLQSKALALCAPDAKDRLKSIPDDGRTYYNYALYPDLTTYETQDEDTVSCALTLSNTKDGASLTGPLW